MMLVVGILLGRGTDARWLIAAGLLVMAAGCYWMARMNLDISPGQVVWPRVVLICGLSLHLRPDQRGGLPIHPAPPARGGGRPVRPAPQRGGQRGHVDQQDHRATARAVPPGPCGGEPQPAELARAVLFSQGQAYFVQQTGDPARSQQLTLQSLDNLRQQQAASLAYFDVFWLFAVLSLGLVLLVFLMKRSVAEKGELIGGE